MIRIETLSAWIGPRGRSVTIHTRVYKRAFRFILRDYIKNILCLTSLMFTLFTI